MNMLIDAYRFGSGGGGPTDPYWANVMALLHFDGTNGSTTFTDQVAGHAWARQGDGALSTAQAKWGPSSFAMDGVNDAVEAISSDFTVGTGEFTDEFWIYPSTLPSNWIMSDQRPDSTQGVYPTIYATGSTLKFFTNSADRISGGTIVTGVWQHVALCRDGSGNTRLFLDGTQVGSTYTDTNNYLGTRIRLGASGVDLGIGMNGYMDDYRRTNAARYTSNFTPPTAAFPNS